MRQKWLLFAQVDKAVTRAILTPGTHLPRVSRCWPEYQRRPGVEAKRDGEHGGKPKFHCEKACKHSGHDRSTTVDPPRPRNEIGSLDGEAAQPQGKWQAHRKAKRCDETGGNDD